jgi:hydroxymethylglutaryl-CoA lyase
LNSKNIRLVECPRDAMQGWEKNIPAATKAAYINALLQVGFDTIDFGSFVSPKAIPQMADTASVLGQLDLSGTATKLLAIVANTRGAEEAVCFEAINYLGFPFSISETFQKRNTNSTIIESLGRVAAIQELCLKNKKELVVYISMGFGNPYGDAYDEALVFYWIDKLSALDIKIVSLADTVGLATAQQVFSTTKAVIENFTAMDIGVHLHATSLGWKEKLTAAFNAGCLRYDGALMGIGGCPMADDVLVGNMDTALMIPFFQEKGVLRNIDSAALEKARQLAAGIFT